MLEHFLISQIFAFLLIFCRVGSGIMVMPGYGETYVSASIRICFALFITLLLTPALGRFIPPLPSSAIMLTLLILNEILIGIFLGSICQILVSAMHTTGTIFSLQAGISSAVVFDSSQNSQGTLAGTFLGILVVVLLFCTDLHYLMLMGITKSYVVFAPGHFPPLDVFVGTISHTVSDVFTISVQISAPFIIAGLLLFLGAGVISRLMPTIQVFFVLVAPQLLLGFFIFMTMFSAIVLFYMDFYRDRIMSIMGYLK